MAINTDYARTLKPSMYLKTVCGLQAPVAKVLKYAVRVDGYQHRLCTHIEAIYVLMTLKNCVCGLQAPVAKVLKYAVRVSIQPRVF